MLIPKRVTATVGAVLLLYSAQTSSAQESSQQSPSATDIPERYRRQVAPAPSTQQVTDVQGFIESSKFEPGAGAADAQEVERLTADAQAVFIVLLAIARDAAISTEGPDAVRAETIRFDDDLAVVLEVLADRIGRGRVAAASEVSGALAAFERSTAAQVDAAGGHATGAGALELYRELALAVNRLASSAGRSIPTAARSIVAG